MDECVASASISSTPSQKIAVNLIQGIRNRLFESETATRKVPFKALFTAILVHLGRVLFQIVVTISGFFPTLIILSHIGGFILERCLEILYTEDNFLRLRKNMVCALEENQVFCVIQDGSESESIRATFHMAASSTVEDLYQKVKEIIQYQENSFNLLLQDKQNEFGVFLRHFKSKTIETVGFKIGPNTKNILVVMPSPENVMEKASNAESGDQATFILPPPPPPLPASTSNYGNFSCPNTLIRPDIGHVGLVNQAMTCYLNSLLQALFMTPEFRNAMYNWEYDGSPNEESKSIPYQLQKLFLNLQTSCKSAVETTELTRSFGWDSWEAWQQHDIQELCRVMFDTLEQKFKNTKQADLINRLYEGKMIDYVKCLECSTEKSREDTFLDIPLPVRPFGSNVAYGSVEEALRAFVQPETLEGNNQYHCDTCNKKCNAHKGLKFSKFPYLLTLHLKRFDFDFNTLHRIKLNDKVSFPERLNLNGFIVQEKGSEKNIESFAEDIAIKCDDSCTTDSGSALDDEVCQNIDSVSVIHSHENHNNTDLDDDEGIDVGQQQENEKNRRNASESGPYEYELFSIMIHSGSAAGGHYYAYIKDFRDGEWYCFNDQNVARITHDDIRKTYGGGPIKGYYSGAYSSSTNAYMLMYRQIDKERNASSMTVGEFPEHIKALHNKLINKLEEQKELDSLVKDIDFDFESCKLKIDFETCKLRIYCHYPHHNAISEAKLYINHECTLKEAVLAAYKRLNLEKIVPVERCRLVSYDKLRESIACSFEGKDEETIGDLYLNHGKDFLMEVRKENEEFEVYKLGDINTIVFLVKVDNEDILGPIVVRTNWTHTVREYKEILSKELKISSELIVVTLQKFSNKRKLLEDDNAQLRHEEFFDNMKVYVTTFSKDRDKEVQKPHILFKFQRNINRLEHTITLYLALPDVDSETLERLKIPSLDSLKAATTNKSAAGLILNNTSRGTSPNPKEASPQLLPETEDDYVGQAGPLSDQSASEDSSLTDSERTIVGEILGDRMIQLSPNNSPNGSNQNVSSLENNDCSTIKSDFYERLLNNVHENEESENWNVDSTGQGFSNSTLNLFFKAVSYTEDGTKYKMLKVLVDKRMTHRTFKQCLEPFVGVSAQHFNIYSKHSDLECSILSDSLDLFKDNEKLTIKLKRALKKGEFLGNIFLLSPSSEEPIKYLFEWIIASDSPVNKVKKEILEEMKRKCAIEIPFNRCRLRKKNWRIPMRPYLSESVFDDLSNNYELFVQELPGEEPLTSPNQKLIIVRQLCPSTQEIKHFEEIVVDTNTVLECKEKISEISGIPVEFLDIAKGPGFFPCLDVSVLTPCTVLEWWNSSSKPLDGSPDLCDEGHVIFYRDTRDKSRSFLTKDRKLLKDRRNRFYFPVKERGLKIYLDLTPPRKEESDVD